jgi:hypothetical protein
MENLKFSAVFKPTSLFSLKDSNSTNSGAKSLFLPSPYAIKMAILNQAITMDGVDFESNKAKNAKFKFIRDSKISFLIAGNYCVNNCFVKILRVKEDKRGKKQKEAGIEFESGVQNTISFREYIHIDEPIEIIFEVQSNEQKVFLQKYLHKINFFGKRGCFFQFMEYRNDSNEPNVKPFNSDSLNAGILQEFDDFDSKSAFENANSFSSSAAKRQKNIFVLPLSRESSSKSYTHYKLI